MKSLADFCSAYGDLHDAVIENIDISYGYGPQYPLITVHLACMSLIKNEDWVFLEIQFYGVREFKFLKLPKTDNEVIYGSSVSYWDNRIIFNFDVYDSAPLTIEEHRQSGFYLVCNEFDFKENFTTARKSPYP